MSDGRSRFCVLFAGTFGNSPVKTRLLHSDSGLGEIIQIWRTLYDEYPPTDARIIINENCVYRLDDEDDLKAFFAQAEDQYRILPSNPLKVILGCIKDYNQSITKVTLVGSTNERAEDLSYRNTSNENNNNSCISPPQVSPARSHVKSEKSPESNKEYKDSHEYFENLSNNIHNANDPPATSGAFMNPYPVSKFAGQTVENAIERISASNNTYSCSKNSPIREKRLSADNHDDYMRRGVIDLPNYDRQQATDAAHPSFCKLPQPSTQIPPQFEVNAYSAFMRGLQGNRAMQTNPSASLILQTILSNQIRSIAAARDSMTANQSASKSLPGFDPLNNNSAAKAFLQNQSPFPSRNSVGAATSQQADMNRNAMIFSSLAYNNNNLLNCFPGAAGAGYSEKPYNNSVPAPPPKKRRRAKTTSATLDGKPIDTAKRMRSSTSQSNIEYHYERALDYSVMSTADQKLQNSAHRSHWKHLLFVVKTSPTFLETFKHAKYDEWSSEARDIFAISQPDKYMWSFLTLSKQGDLLCKRILGRIGNLIDMKNESRPEWCPTNEVLERARTKATERLSQLQRILYSRSMNNENNKNHSNSQPKSKQVDKYAMLQDRNLAFMNAYHQRQKEFMQSQGALEARLPNFPGFNAAKTPPRPVAVAPPARPYCSSVTSSPVSIISPTAEQGFNQDGSHDDQTDSPPSTPGEVPSRRASDNDGCLVIDTERKSSSEKSPISTSSSNHSDNNKDSHMSIPLSVNNGNIMSSPLRWSIAANV